MYDRIDQLVEINLKLLAEARGQKMFRSDFVDEKGKQLLYSEHLDSEKLASYMREKRLVDIEPSKGEDVI